MLIINADDLGRNTTATDNIVDCWRHGLITSASAMVFLNDSRRAAELALNVGLVTGLHLNLTQPFNGKDVPERLQENHLAIARYLRRGKWARLIYNPLLKNAFDYVFRAQLDEYRRLYSREPAQIDGHHHMHLCLNIVLGRIIPPGVCVRRNFSLGPGEDRFMNRFYRRAVDRRLVRRYRCTDLLFSLEMNFDPDRLAGIVGRSLSSNVELMVHPELAKTCDFLLNPAYRELIAGVPKGTFLELARPRT